MAISLPKYIVLLRTYDTHVKQDNHGTQEISFRLVFLPPVFFMFFLFLCLQFFQSVRLLTNSVDVDCDFTLAKCPALPIIQQILLFIPQLCIPVNRVPLNDSFLFHSVCKHGLSP